MYMSTRRRNVRKLSLLAVPVLLLSLYAYSTAATQSSCVTCHTSESILKKLCKPPEIPVGEGEG